MKKRRKKVRDQTQHELVVSNSLPSVWGAQPLAHTFGRTLSLRNPQTDQHIFVYEREICDELKRCGEDPAAPSEKGLKHIAGWTANFLKEAEQHHPSGSHLEVLAGRLVPQGTTTRQAPMSPRIRRGLASWSKKFRKAGFELTVDHLKALFLAIEGRTWEDELTHDTANAMEHILQNAVVTAVEQHPRVQRFRLVAGGRFVPA